MYDIIIIGAGPAGISAGIYAVSRGKKTLIIEKNEVGGTIGKVSTVTHYPAILPGETGTSFAARLKSQAVSSGVQIIYENVERVSLLGDTKSVFTNNNHYQASKVILAGGTTPRKLNIPGEAELTGKGIGLNAAKDGALYTGKNMYVVGGADGAVKEALYLSNFAKTLTIIHFEERLGCIPEFSQKVEQTPNIRVRLLSRLHAVYGKDHVESLEISCENKNSLEMIKDDGCGIFVYAGASPNTDMYSELALKDGYIPVNEKMETAIKGVYAAGDICVKQVRQAATAVADGAIAAINAAM